MIGHTNSRTTDTAMETRPVTMATQRLPLKNASQPVRELRVFEAVIAACADDTGDDSDKYVLDLVKCQRFYRIIRDCGHQRGNNAGAQQVGHHQPGYQTGQCRGTLAVVG